MPHQGTNDERYKFFNLKFQIYFQELKQKLLRRYDRLPLLIVCNLGKAIKVKYLGDSPKDFRR